MVRRAMPEKFSLECNILNSILYYGNAKNDAFIIFKRPESFIYFSPSSKVIDKIYKYSCLNVVVRPPFYTSKVVQKSNG